jgi:hypothetical protein
MDRQRRLFISRMSVLTAVTVFNKPLRLLAMADSKFGGSKLNRSKDFIALQNVFLNKDLSDALCTLIVIGYAKNVKNCTFQYEGANKDQAKASKEKGDYGTVQKLLQAWGVPVTVSSSIPSKDFPFVVALNKKIATIDQARAALAGSYTDYLAKINNNANAINTPPVGAYIGGLCTISKLFIVGPSKLDQYKPTYRLADDAAVKKSFESAKLSTNNAIKAIASIARPTASEVTHADLNSLENSSFSSGNLYKSYHGMIQAMVNYKSNADTNSFIFEIALGENTTKVSSCFACSAYMTANGIPASSTHLGRSDNWNIPSVGDASYKNWAGKIADWYAAGKSVCAKAKSGSNIDKLLSELAKNNREKDIHNIYLEALTFEGSFTDRIINTLNNAKA